MAISGDPERSPLSLRTTVVAGLVLIACVAVIGVIGLGTGSAPAEWAGTVLAEPLERPDVQLADTSGEIVDLSEDPDEAVTLVMFGYTNCPDVCPISLATLASALDSMEPEVSRNIRMVFITADPHRDTPEVLRSYLDQYDERFIGLTGSDVEIVAAQEEANVPPAVIEDADEQGDYAVGHATQMIAYQRDGAARIVYPFGTREADWTRDLPRLVAGDRPQIVDRDS